MCREETEQAHWVKVQLAVAEEPEPGQAVAGAGWAAIWPRVRAGIAYARNVAKKCRTKQENLAAQLNAQNAVQTWLEVNKTIKGGEPNAMGRQNRSGGSRAGDRQGYGLLCRLSGAGVC